MKREDVIKKLEEKYPNKGYVLLSKNEIFHKYDKLEIMCPKHGKINPVIDDIIYGKKTSGCRKCGLEISAEKQTLSLKEFEKRLIERHNNRFKIINYTAFSKKIIVYDNEKNIEITILPRNLLNNDYSSKKKIEQRINKNRNYFLKKVKENNVPYKIIDITQYENWNSHIDFLCEKHGIFNSRADSVVLGGCGCIECFHETQKRTKEEFIKISNDIHEFKYDYSKTIYINNITKVIIICPIHGDFLQRPKQHIKGEGCIHCYESKGEKKIERILKEKRIEYTREQTFNGCTNPKTNRKLRFDFFINNKILLEYDGEQHFIDKVSGFYTKEMIEDTIYRDEIKNEFCKKNGIKLIRIPYFKFNEIENIIKAGFEVVL